MVDIQYPARLKREDSGYFIEFVDLPDIFAEGATIQEALDNAIEVLSAMLTWRMDEMLNIPPPSSHVQGAEYIAPDTTTQLSLIKYRKRFDKS